jgi:hypothetical protein
MIRAWFEGPDARLIARVHWTPDVAQQHLSADVAGSADDICRIVLLWLESMRRPAKDQG